MECQQHKEKKLLNSKMVNVKSVQMKLHLTDQKVNTVLVSITIIKLEKLEEFFVVIAIHGLVI